MSNTPAEPLPAACASVRAALAGAGASPADLLHLTSCSRCRLAARHLRRLYARSRRLPLDPSPSALRARVLEQVNLRAIPEPFQPDVPDGAGKPFAYGRLVGITAATCATLAAGSALVANWPRLFPSIPTQVRQVPNAARSWHFSGWRSESGKRVKWEVWGRHEPFLYREQIGDLIFVDTSSTRTQVLPPSPARPRGLVLISDRGSVPPLGGLSMSNVGFLANLGYGWERLWQVRRNGQEYLLGGSIARVADVPDPLVLTPNWGYTSYQNGVPTYVTGSDGRPRAKQRVEDVFQVHADVTTKTPTRLILEEVRYAPRDAQTPRGNQSTLAPAPPVVGRGRDKGPVVARETTAELTLEYNVPLPADVQTPPAPAAYPRMNLTQTVTDRPGDNRIAAKGFTMDAQGRADSDGNIRVWFAAFLNGKPYPNPDLPANLGVSVQPVQSQNNTQTGKQESQGGVTDDQGRRYMLIVGPEYRPLDRKGGISDVYLAPMDPLRPGAPRPRHLRISLSVSGGPSEIARDRHQVKPVTLISAHGEVVVPLPTTPVSLGYDVPVPPDPGLPAQPPRFRRTLALQLAESRAQAYESRAFSQPTFVSTNQTPAEKAATQNAAAEKARCLRAAIAFYHEAARLAAQQPNHKYEVESYHQRAANALRQLKQP